MLIAIPQGVWGQITVADVSPDNEGYFEGLSGVKFNSQTSTLTLSNGASVGQIIYSGTSNLTIAFGGTCSITTEETYAIQYTGSESNRPKLSFSLTESTTGSLSINGGSLVIKGFSDVDFGSLNLASTSAQGVYYDSSEYGYHMAGPAGNPSDLTITTDTYYPIWIFNPSLMSTGYPYTQLRGESAITIGEGTVSGTVSFDGDHTITISNVAFNYDGNTMIVVGPSMEQLTVNLDGTSSAGNGSIFLSLWATTPLTFTTSESTPGSLTGYGIVSWMDFGNGQISYQNGLNVFYDVENSYKKTISTTGTYFKIGNTEVSATGDITTAGGTAHFDASSNTLTLTGATIGGATAASDIKAYVDDLIIEISGTNTIYGNITYNGSNYQSSNIQINKASNEGTHSLTVNNIGGFASCTWGDGLYLTGHGADNAIIDVHYEQYEGEGGSMESYYGEIADVTFSTTQPSNTIWVAGHVPNSEGVIEGTGISEGTVTYNDGVLTLTNVSLSTSETNPLIICNGDLTVELEGSNNNVNFNGDYSTYIFKNNGTTGTLTFTGDGTLHINSDYKEGTYFGLCDGFSTVNFGDLAYTINGDTKYISPLNISTPMMNVFEGKIEFITDGYLFGSTTYYKIIYADGSGNEEEVPLTNVVSNQTFDFSNYNEKITISELTGPCTVYAYTKYKEETGASAKAKLFGPASTKQTIVLDADPVELAFVPAIEEGDGIKISGIEANYLSYDSETGKVTGTALGSTTFPVPLSYTSGEYTPGNTIILNSGNFQMQVEVVRDLGIEFVGTNLWASYYSTEEKDLAVPEGLTAYVVSAVNEKTGVVNVEAIDYIPAYEAILLQREENGAASGYTAGLYTDVPEQQVNNLLVGSAEATDISSIANSPVYVLFNDQFKRATSGTIPARRAYLALGAAVAPSGAPRYMNINIGDGSVTAIKTVAVDETNDSWYTIDGLKLNGKPQRKGLYINKGKKMYINNNK